LSTNGAIAAADVVLRATDEQTGFFVVVSRDRDDDMIVCTGHLLLHCKDIIAA
jgi:hypothetical protein